MGLFSKKHTSPSGYFNADGSNSDNEDTANLDSAATRLGQPGRRSAEMHGTEAREREGGTGEVKEATRERETGEEAAPVAGARDDKEHSHIGHQHNAGMSGAGAGAAAAATGAAAASSTPQTTPPSTASARKPVPRASLDSTSSATHSAAAPTSPTVKETSAPPKHRHRVSLSKDAVLSAEEARRAAHEHQYLEPVVHERRHIHEVEEVERRRTVDRHVHHVQHHVQPLLDERHLEVVHSYREVPVNHIEESHAATAADKALLARLNAQTASTYTVVPHERVRVDKGETQVIENVVHHYHVIVQPVWQRDLHEYYRLTSDFSSATAPPSAATNGAYVNSASPAAQGAGAAHHVPLTPSMHGAPVRTGSTLVPDTDGATYEVQYVNREPVVPGRAGEGFTDGGMSSHTFSSTAPLAHPHASQTVGGALPSAKEHFPAGAHGVGVHEATGVRGQTQPQPQGQGEMQMRAHDLGTIERGVAEMGVAK
ncbi:hypothetical protein JCM10207_000334 [Rhodosporidiobolus poonsookiae]